MSWSLINVAAVILGQKLVGRPKSQLDSLIEIIKRGDWREAFNHGVHLVAWAHASHYPIMRLDLSEVAVRQILRSLSLVEVYASIENSSLLLLLLLVLLKIVMTITTHRYHPKMLLKLPLTVRGGFVKAVVVGSLASPWQLDNIIGSGCSSLKRYITLIIHGSCSIWLRCSRDIGKILVINTLIIFNELLVVVWLKSQ